MERVILIRPKEIALRFAKKVNISNEKAGYIEYMRDRYICYEHDYVGTPPGEKDSL